MKTYRNSKRWIFAVISTAFLCCNLTKAAAYFDPLKDAKVVKSYRPLGDTPCVWPDPPINPGPDPGPGAPDCIIPINCVAYTENK